MLVFPGMLAPACEDAGISFPNDEELERYENDTENGADERAVADKYPHFHVFCNVQLCRPMGMDGEHFRNAKIIAKVPAEKLRTTTLQDLLALGLEWRQ